MKFIQLLSTIASLAIFATAPGVSAAGLRAGVDKEEASGRRNLQAVIYGLPGQVQGMPGMSGMPGMPGMHYGMPGTVHGMPTGPNMYSDESSFYNRKYNNGYNGGRGRGYKHRGYRYHGY